MLKTESSDMEEEKAENDDVSSEDVLTLLKDGISRYKSVLFGVISKDATAVDDSSEEVFAAELLILQQLEGSTAYSRSILENCLHSLLLHKCVRIENVFKWLLHDINEKSEGKEVRFCRRWWELAISSIQLYINQITATDSNASSAMSVDDGLDSSALNTQKFQNVLEFLEPLLHYTIRRVCCILISISTLDAKQKKLTPDQVDLVEGLKYLIVDTYSIVLGCAQGSHMSRTELKSLLAESSISATKLVASISEHNGVGGAALDILRRSLQRL
jgi:hypothetical protein